MSYSPLIPEGETNENGIEDSVSDMLYTRRIARFLSRFEWYYPQRESAEGTLAPSLAAGWHYFEHVTLARYIEGEESDSGPKDQYLMAARGISDVKTHLYPMKCPERQLGDFGIGVGMYFANLRTMALLLLGAGLINLYPILYYRSSTYSDNQEGIADSLKGSAACTEQTWYPCTECSKDDFSASSIRFTNVTGTDGTVLKFIKKNECPFDFYAGLASWLALIFVIAGYAFLRYRERKRAVLFDEAEQSTSDYSVSVTNPPLDARDPEEWKKYFCSVCEDAHITFVTVVLDNEDLVSLLVERKQLLLQFANMLPPGVPLDVENLKEQVELIPSSPKWMKWKTTGSSVYEKIIELDAKIDELSKTTFGVSEIFVTFETEQSQREVLKKLDVSSIGVMKNKKGSLPDEYLFRGEHILKVIEPSEPNSVRWQDLDEPIYTQLKQRAITLSLSFISIIIAAVIIYLCNRNVNGIYFGMTVASIMITFFNTIVPMFVKYLLKFESHRSEGSWQESLFLKICTFRWINTALILAVITPFTGTLTADVLVENVFSLFFTQIISTPFIQMGDPTGHINRHYRAPRALDQRSLNSNFLGKAYILAERYTDTSKVLILTFFYAGLFPMGFLYGAAALIVHYIVDKFCLLKVWAAAPKVGTQITYVSSKFTQVGILVYAFMITYQMSGFPFDDACLYQGDDSSTILEPYIGIHNLTEVNDIVDITSVDSTKLYKVCNQDLIRNGFKFPFFAAYQGVDKWMTDDQEKITYLFGCTLCIMLVYSLALLARTSVAYVKSLFYPSFKPHGKASDHAYSEFEIEAYVPQVKIPNFVYPHLLCDVRGLDEHHIGWRTPDADYDNFNLMYEIPSVKAIKEEEVDVQNCIFSIVKYYPVINDDEIAEEKSPEVEDVEEDE